MGQFLAVGLVTKMTVEKSEAEKADMDLDLVKERLNKDLYFDTAIYDVSEGEGYYRFLLNEQVFQTQLIPLLKDLYPLLYPNSGSYFGVIEKLATMPPAEWLTWADDLPEEAFQVDKYGEWDYIENGHKSARVYFRALMLSAEGKIMMETYGRHFSFWKYTM